MVVFLWHGPDLIPCDYDLFLKEKEPFRDLRYRTAIKIPKAIDLSLQTIGTSSGILRLSHRWKEFPHDAVLYSNGFGNLRRRAFAHAPGGVTFIKTGGK
ncbi:hypothetical protein AVEN_99409-1 [Araneus ventricosus]|uniref:Uncharacterized protein n=1 Tax=Araneus ventricosus TaxID=182803 RepID=A0A4Y2SRI3_ARAVE|nr:hypothetical protein AVEN_99409-1 [Araneus ventricosus]